MTGPRWERGAIIIVLHMRFISDDSDLYTYCNASNLSDLFRKPAVFSISITAVCVLNHYRCSNWTFWSFISSPAAV